MTARVPGLYATDPSPEGRLVAGYRNARRGPDRRTEDCACGGEITAETGWEAAAVDEHNGGLRHAAWRVEFRARWQ